MRMSYCWANPHETSRTKSRSNLSLVVAKTSPWLYLQELIDTLSSRQQESSQQRKVGSEYRANEVHRIVAHLSAILEACAHHAVEQHSCYPRDSNDRCPTPFHNAG